LKQGLTTDTPIGSIRFGYAVLVAYLLLSGFRPLDMPDRRELKLFLPRTTLILLSDALDMPSRL
jgi:hypothetical protein